MMQNVFAHNQMFCTKVIHYKQLNLLCTLNKSDEFGITLAALRSSGVNSPIWFKLLEDGCKHLGMPNKHSLSSVFYYSFALRLNSFYPNTILIPPLTLTIHAVLSIFRIIISGEFTQTPFLMFFFYINYFGRKPFGDVLKRARARLQK